MKRYEVTARRAGSWWAFEVHGVPGALGQARRLEQVEGAARDVAAMMLGVDERDVDVELRPLLADDVAVHVDEVRRRRAQAELAAAVALLGAVVAVRQLRKAGLPDRDTAELLGISHQRVSQLAKEDQRALRRRVAELEAAAA